MDGGGPGAGWWLASDGRWYPPEAVPGPPTAPPPPPVGPQPTGPAVVGDAGGSAREKAAKIQRAADAWQQGGEGEQQVGARLATLPAGFAVLHDLRLPGSTANIDHLVIGPTGVWLIDTKSYNTPLRVADGTVWRGKYPMRREQAAVAEAAAIVSASIGAPVSPVLCFVANRLPQPEVGLGSVVAVTDESLLGLLTRPRPVGPVDVGELARRAMSMQPVAAATAARPVKAKAQRRTPKANGGAPSGRSMLLRFVGLAAFVAFLFLGGSRLIVGLSARAGEEIGERTMNQFVSTTTTASTLPLRLDGPVVETPSPKLGLAVLCVERGAGHQVSFVWPMALDPQLRPIAYELTPTVAGVPAGTILWRQGEPKPAPLTGIPPTTEATVTAQAILADGTRLTPSVTTRTTPARAC